MGDVDPFWSILINEMPIELPCTTLSAVSRGGRDGDVLLLHLGAQVIQPALLDSALERWVVLLVG